MKTLVVDNNVWIKLVSSEKEKHVDLAIELYENVKAGEVRVLVPSLWLLEVANVLIGSKRMSAKEVIKFVQHIIASGVLVVDFELKDLGSLVCLMDKWNITSYDATYLLLAKENNCRLVTEDKKLLKSGKFCVSLKDLAKNGNE